MQQHQLRLDFDVEAARGLEQPHQHQTQRNFAQRALEIRLAHGAHSGLQLFHAGVCGYPARFEVQLGDAAIIAPEKGHEVLHQILFVKIGE